METMKVKLYTQYGRLTGVMVSTVVIPSSVVIQEKEIEVNIPNFDEDKLVVEAIKSEIEVAKRDSLKTLRVLEKQLEEAKCKI